MNGCTGNGMSDGESDSEKTPFKKPKIIKLGNFGTPVATSANSNNGVLLNFDGDEIHVEPDSWSFVPNQRAELMTHSDGILEITTLQEESTPGARSKFPIILSPVNYTLTVVGHADSESTFFPWAMDDENIRLTPTVHISTVEEPISVQFRLTSEAAVFFGVLSHRQEVGDKCYIQSFHISRSTKFESNSSRGSFKSIQFDELIPHQNSTLSIDQGGIRLRSKPISTPGAYALVDVTPESTITLFVRVSIVHPSVAFLYVADSETGRELIKRNVIFESAEAHGDDNHSELYSSVQIPSNVSQIRLGLLFSTVTQPEEHEMTIHVLEVAEYRQLGEIVEEAYVINMLRDKEKFDFCQHQADRFDFPITRWEAVDGNSEPHLSNWNEYMEEPWTELDDRLGRKAIDRKGAWGYLLSMRGIIVDAIEKNHDSIAIFDDDFILSNSFDHNFSKLIELIDESWDVFYLGASQWLWDGINQSEMNVYPPNENTNGSFAVLYRSSVFERLLQEIDLMQAPFDAGPLRNVVLESSRGKSFVAHPNIVIANLEKPGIRESRNQLEFSKRFGWDLDQFPSWFSSWSATPTILRDTGEKKQGDRGHFVTAVTTINRKEYLQRFVSDWLSTKSNSADSTLIVADDGSTDGTLEWLIGELDVGESRLIVVKNNGGGIARQTNSILEILSTMGTDPDAIFMCNDDILFLKSGWDDSYFSAMKSSGFDHLVYFNPDWKKPSHFEKSDRYEGLVSYCSARDAMGCFYTLTPRLIDSLGFFDEESFPVRGHSHVDYTIRACRCEANDTHFLFDLINSNELIGMVMRDGYKRTFRTLSVKEMRLTTGDSELSKRESILLREGRIFVPKEW